MTAGEVGRGGRGEMEGGIQMLGIIAVCTVAKPEELDHFFSYVLRRYLVVATVYHFNSFTLFNFPNYPMIAV